jgi:hypothetical protein
MSQRKPKINVTAHTDPRGRTRIGFDIMEYDSRGNGGGVGFSLSAKAAVVLADKLNAILDDPR